MVKSVTHDLYFKLYHMTEQMECVKITIPSVTNFLFKNYFKTENILKFFPPVRLEYEK